MTTKKKSPAPARRRNAGRRLRANPGPSATVRVLSTGIGNPAPRYISCTLCGFESKALRDEDVQSEVAKHGRGICG